MTKHLHFVQSVEPLEGGGLGKAVLGLHQALLESGSSSRVLTTRDSVFRESFPEILQLPRRGPKPLFLAPAMVKRAPKEVGDAEIVHGHGFYVAVNWILGRQAVRQGKPLVYHPHGFLDPWIRQRSRWKKKIAHWLFEDRNFKQVSLWRALTKKEAGQIRALEMPGAIEIIPNGVSPPLYSSPAEEKSLRARIPRQHSKRFICLSRIHPKKGFDLLLPALSKLPKECGDWELAIFGPDENGYLGKVKRMASNLGIEHACSFHGPVEGKTKEMAFLSGDIFLLPSHSEGFPMALLEASIRGIPSVFTTECNFPELAEQGAGWECSPSLESLGQTLIEAVSADRDEIRERGAAARNLAEKEYSWTAVARKLEEACRTHC